MNLDDRITAFEAIQARQVAALPRRLRPFSREITWKGRAILLLGPRGVGKTTLLLSRSAPHRLLYLSLDSPLAAGPSLWDLGQAAFMKGYDGLICDEVHHARDWSIHLKALYDAFPDKSLWASDSSSLLLRQGLADLSRRFPVIDVPFLSLREYLCLTDGFEGPPVDPFALSSRDAAALLRESKALARFRDYLDGGTRPFFLEGDYARRLTGILDKSLHGDIPHFVPQMTENHFRLLEAVISYLALSDIPTVNVESLCGEWGLSKAKLYALLQSLEAIGLLRIVRKKGDFKTLSKGAKLLFQDPSLYVLWGKNRGTQREAFAVTALTASGRTVWASDDESRADFVTDRGTLEIGGRGKKRKKADVVLRDDTDLPDGGALPLWLLAMAW